MTYPAEILADSPSLYYKFDDLTATSAPGQCADSSGNGRHGDYQNNPTILLASLLGDGSGTSVVFNGTNQFVFLNNHAFMYSTSETITIRFRPTTANLTGDAHIASRWQSGGNTHQFLLYLHNGKVQGSIFDSVQRDATGATLLVAGTNYTVGMRYNNTTGVLSVLLNGVVDGSLSGLGTIPVGTGSAIEIARAAAAVYGAVRVDEFAFFQTALSDARILAQHNAAISSAATLAGSVTFTESSVLTVTGAREQPAIAVMAETSSLTTAGTRTQPATVTMSETSTMTVPAVIVIPASVTMTESSSLTSSADVTSDVTVTMTETSSLNVSADVAQVMTEVWGMILI